MSESLKEIDFKESFNSTQYEIDFQIFKGYILMFINIPLSSGWKIEGVLRNKYYNVVDLET